MSDVTQPISTASNAAQWDEPAFAALTLQPQDWALFLDIDGTLIDLAITPEAIVVPDFLPTCLDAVARKLNGALALVTGRSVTFADQMFTPFHFPIAGLHGAERRDIDGNLYRRPPSADFEALKLAIAHEARDWVGIVIEDKGGAIAAHYRLAPERQTDVEAMMARAVQQAGPNFRLQFGKMVVEIRPAGADKGVAVLEFLEQTPFRGRRPLVIGDDLTDEAMFLAANTIGGHSIRIGPPSGRTEARSFIPTPTLLRQSLVRLAS